MSDTDNLFLTIFRDLKIVVDEHNSSENNTSYNCFLNEQLVSYNKVIGLIKQYQDKIIEMMLKESQEN